MGMTEATQQSALICKAFIQPCVDLRTRILDMINLVRHNLLQDRHNLLQALILLLLKHRDVETQHRPRADFYRMHSTQKSHQIIVKLEHLIDGFLYRTSLFFFCLKACECNGIGEHLTVPQLIANVPLHFIAQLRIGVIFSDNIDPRSTLCLIYRILQQIVGDHPLVIKQSLRHAKHRRRAIRKAFVRNSLDDFLILWDKMHLAITHHLQQIMGDIKCHRPLSIESVLLPAEGKRPQRSFIFGSYAFQMPNWNEPSEVDDECRQLNEYPPDGKRPSSLKPHLSYCYLKRMLEPHSMLQ